MERLASGKRINSAMDDAAGLAIAHSLDSKISSLNQGIRNANDGISMLQTAEGALEETSSMLNRMKELATQASSGSYSSSDRIALNAEFQALASAVTSIAKETDFNGTNMLNSTNSVSFQVGDGSTDHVSMKFQQMKATDLSIFDTGSAVLELADRSRDDTIFVNGEEMQPFDFIIGSVAPSATASLEMDINGKTYTQVFITDAATTMQKLAAQITVDNENIDIGSTTATRLYLWSPANGEEWTSTGLKVISDSTDVVGTTIYTETQVNGAAAKQAGTHTISAVTAANQTLSVEINGTTYSQDFDTDATVTMAALASKVNNGTTNLTAVATSSTVLTLTSTSNGAGYTTGAMQRTSNFGGNASILTAAGATQAMSALDESIGQVDSYRSELGAVANRLDHTVSNLMSRAENQSAAKSRIEDTDFAVESANLSKALVLQKAGTAMLAQANASRRGVLSLLK
jgi:flagellin